MAEKSLCVAFLGLGTMGSPMAGHLAKAGHRVQVFNRTFAKALEWKKTYGGEAFETAIEAVKDADFVMLCLGNDQDIRSVCLGQNGIIPYMKAGSILIDHTTASATVAHELASACAAQGSVQFLDAPVSGGQSGAENGKLTIMCGGDKSVFDSASPILTAYSQSAALMGGHGSGQLAKMVNQICIAGMVQALSEAIHFCKAANLDGEAVLNTISKGAAQSWQMDNRGKTMLDGKYDFGFAVDWMRKDLGMCLEEARRMKITLPVTALVDQFYGQVQNLGGSRFDTSSLLMVLEENTKKKS